MKHFNAVNEQLSLFLEKCRDYLPIQRYLAIEDAVTQEMGMFKSVALHHIVKCYKQRFIKHEVLLDLVDLLDSFTDPYEEFVKEFDKSWDDIKKDILEGIA